MTTFLFGPPTTTPSATSVPADAARDEPTGTGPDAPSSAILPTELTDPPATPRWMWRVALLTLVGTLLARMPALRERVAAMLVDTPAVTEELTEDHLRELALNVGLGLAVLLSAVLLGQPSVRDQLGFYAWVVAVGLIAPLPFWRYWRSVARSRKVVLFAVAVAFALMGTLI